MNIHDWLSERRDNAKRIAALKAGQDRAGWLEDAAYFALALDELSKADALAEDNARLRAALKRIVSITAGHGRIDYLDVSFFASEALNPSMEEPKQ